MNAADEHAGEAEISLAAADREWEAMDLALQNGRELTPEQESNGWREIRRHQLDAIGHALLALRPEPQVIEVKVGDIRQVDGEDVDPDDLPWGTVITATVDGRECVRMVRADLSAVSWHVHPDDVRDGMTWAIGSGLSDVRVVRLGPKL